ncbi:MAG: ABC transporter permease [Gemmatimonadota bacterium]|nr:ABC transporter permease [Gemmatimonadota bacterium]
MLSASTDPSRVAMRRSAAGSTRLLRTAPIALGVLVAIAVFAPILTPYASDALDLAHRRASPSFAHLFGTDELGRDLLTRVMFGARVSLSVGLISAFLSIAIGTAVGAVAGYARGWADDVLMRATDAMLCIPRLPFLMMLAAIVHPTVPALVLLIGLVNWMETARVVRTAVQSVAAREFVSAARASGASATRVLMRHVLPGALPAITVASTLAVGRGILLESALSFFGVGVQPPVPSWGNMLYQAQSTMTSEPWLALFPGLMIFATVLACNAIGDVVAR